MGFNNDHLEDWDSQQGDVEEGSRGATQASTLYDESVKRGILNAQTEQLKESSRTPGRFMEDVLGGGGYSITTGKMDQMMDGEHESRFDTYTYDGSTITSANDITHKKFQPQQTVVQFPHHPGVNNNNNGKDPELKLGPSRSTESTSYGSSKRSGESQVEKLCCGLGRLGIVLVSLALIAVSLAFVLWLVLSQQQSSTSTQSSPSSACCKGNFEPDWSGREICSSTDVCCVVCVDSVVTKPEVTKPPRPSDKPEEAQPSPSPSTATPEVTDVPQETKQTPSPSTAPSAALTSGKVATPAPTTAPTDPCCSENKFGDFIGRVRCSEASPNDCCQVCTTPDPTPTPTEAPLPCCANKEWGDYVGRKRCSPNDALDCCHVCTP